MAEIPLFPLSLVVFPGGRLSLQIFEQRYLTMVKNCMKDDVGFGVIMINKGHDVLHHAAEALPNVARCGTYCRIVDFDQQTNGLLQIAIEGEVKFNVRDNYESNERLMFAQVELLPLEVEAPIPENKRHLVNLLETLTQHEAVRLSGLKVNFESAVEVGARLTELLPCESNFKQQMLEMDNPVLRLLELEKQLFRMQG